MSLYKGDTPTFVDNKWWPWGPALLTTVLGFNYVYGIDINIERLALGKLALGKYTSQILLSLVQAIKYNKLPLLVNALYYLLFSYFEDVFCWCY